MQQHVSTTTVSLFRPSSRDQHRLPRLSPVSVGTHFSTLFVSTLTEPYCQGVNVADINKLKAAGIVTVLGVAQTPRRNLMKIKVSFCCHQQHNAGANVKGVSEVSGELMRWQLLIVKAKVEKFKASSRQKAKNLAY
jgi:hypothetical protein